MSLTSDLASLTAKDGPVKRAGPPPLVKCLGFNGSSLFSPARFGVWKDNRLEAGCDIHFPLQYDPPHVPPEKDCTCGIYAGPWERAREYLWTTVYRGSVTAVPVLVAPDPTGKIIVHETGWRAQRAEVIGVLCPLHLEQELPETLLPSRSARSGDMLAASKRSTRAADALHLPVLCVTAGDISAAWQRFLAAALAEGETRRAAGGLKASQLAPAPGNKRASGGVWMKAYWTGIGTTTLAPGAQTGWAGLIQPGAFTISPKKKE